VLFGKFRILGKLALLVLVPLLGVVALSVPIVLNRIGVATDARDTSNTVKLAARVGSAVQELQEERLLSIGYYFQLVQQPDLVVQSAKAQDAIDQLNHLDQPLPTTLRRAVANAAKLNNTRQNVLNRAVGPDVIINEFTNAVTPIINGLNLRGDADLSTNVGRQVFALDQALRSDDQISQASAWLIGAVSVGTFATTDTQRKAAAGLVSAFYSVLIQLQSAILSGQPYFTPGQYQLYLSAQEAFAARVGPKFLTDAVTDPNKAVNSLNLGTLFPSLQSVNVLGGFVEKRIAADVNSAVAKNERDALRTAFLVGGASLLLLLLVFALSIFMARAVARPLRRLTFSADRIARAAETELQRVADDDAETARPIRLDPVDVEAKDEIGDLARAFDRVQTTAVRLVERQVAGRRNVAQMFGHVGRRTQNLVGRQLALIDNLERRETDSDRLRELYRLDHMSSRLRRNASSLVVLSGGAGANEHMAPLPLSDVVRLALGEIEDYTRVDVDVPEEIVVVPSVVADLTLLLAELMENATSFSPPQTRIVVTAAELRGGARLAVVDQGLGLPPDRLAEENARLTRRERLDLAPSEVLGLFVVGRLARRHDIEVTLTDTPEGGLTAWVDLRPVHLVSRAESMPIASPHPIQATVGGHLTEFTPLLAGTSNRTAPGSAQPFDANVLNRATRTLQAARSWNAFIPVRTAPELEAGPSSYAEPARQEPAQQAPVYQAYTEPTYGVAQVPQYEEPPRHDIGTPVAGRFPGPMPELPVAHPTTGGYADLEPPVVMEGPIVMSAPADAIQLPRQRVGDQRPVSPAPRNGTAQSPLRRRVPGNQLPLEAGTKLPTAPPSTDDALAAREAFEAFEDGVNRAQWDVIEADMSSPPAAGHAPLARRVPGASLPVTEPRNPVPPAGPAQPLDPDAARALVEQFEYGVALALNETQPQHEGQPR
jgi:signal transduction histidine kinase